MRQAKQRNVDRLVMTERDLREQVRELCKLFGWKMHFNWLSIHSPRGFPDLFLANVEQKRVIVAELKTEKGKVTPEQEEWLAVLRACGIEAYVWRPSQFEEILARLRN